MVDSPWVADQKKTLGKKKLTGRRIQEGVSMSGVIDRRKFKRKRLPGSLIK